MKMYISQLENSPENWYKAVLMIAEDIIIGYGTTHTLAMKNAFMNLKLR